MTPRASVVIPCHDKPLTLPLTVDTVLRQSVGDLEVLLLGDGVTDDVRRVIERLVADDSRVRFLDFPKGPHHGEKYRHDAILAAESDAIFYLCDDDLLLPEHVADLLALLERANFVQCLNGFARPDGTLSTYAADLADPSHVAPILRTDLGFNSVSITGTAHSREFYLRVGRPWETTPAGVWPDLFQWRKLMGHLEFRGATSSRMTAVQLPTSEGGRDLWTQEERQEELARWHALVTAPDSQHQLDELVHRGALAQLADFRAESPLIGHILEARTQEVARLRERIAGLTETRAARDEAILELRRRLRRVRGKLQQAEAELAALRSSLSWRLTAPMRSSRQRISARRRRG
jgi:hypothetical protein